MQTASIDAVVCPGSVIAVAVLLAHDECRSAAPCACFAARTEIRSGATCFGAAVSQDVPSPFARSSCASRRPRPIAASMKAPSKSR